MANNVIMKGRDALSAKLGECFVTINGNRYNFMQMIDFEAKFEKNKIEVPILGKTGSGNKAGGWKGTFSGTAHYNQSLFRQMMLNYKNTGEDAYFEIQITNEDSTCAAGRQTIVLMDCNIDGGVLTKFDADGEYLDEDIDGTFEDFSMPETFKLLDGML
ncbi:MAG: phage tail tube protein [Raoultibacter sp.]